MFIGMYWPRSPETDWCAPAPTDVTPKPQSYSAGRLLADGTMDGSQFLDCWTKSPQVIGVGRASGRDRRRRVGKSSLS